MIEFTKDGRSIWRLGTMLPVYPGDYLRLASTGWLALWIDDGVVLG